MKKNTVKKITVLASTLIMTAALMGCGAQDKNAYVTGLNELSEQVSVMEEESIQATEAFGNNPTNEHLREEYAAALVELADLYLQYGELPVVDDVKAEHQLMVDSATEIATTYQAMSEVILDLENDFGTNAGIMVLVDVAEDSATIAADFSETMGALTALLNE